MAARRATRPTKTTGQDAAVEIAAEFPLHGCRHPLPVPVPFPRQCEVGLQVLPDEAVEDGLLGAATGVGSGGIPVGWRPYRQRGAMTWIAVFM